MMVVMDDDFVSLFLLLSCQHPSITRQVGLNQLSSTYYPVFVNVGDDVLDMFA